MNIRNRIIERRRMRIGDLALPAAPLYRPDEEHLDAREGLLVQIGQYQHIAAYQHPERGLTLLLDEQIPLAMVNPDLEWDIAITDLSPDEAQAARGGEAAAINNLLKDIDTAALDALLRDVSIDSPAVAQMLAELSFDVETLFEQTSGDGGEGGGSRALGRAPASVKVVVSVAQVRAIEDAIRATSVENRGAALTAICQFYLEHHNAPEG